MNRLGLSGALAQKAPDAAGDLDPEETTCEACGASLPAGAKFCPQCGAPVEKADDAGQPPKFARGTKGLSSAMKFESNAHMRRGA